MSSAATRLALLGDARCPGAAPSRRRRPLGDGAARAGAAVGSAAMRLALALLGGPACSGADTTDLIEAAVRVDPRHLEGAVSEPADEPGALEPSAGGLGVAGPARRSSDPPEPQAAAWRASDRAARATPDGAREPGQRPTSERTPGASSNESSEPNEPTPGVGAPPFADAGAPLGVPCLLRLDWEPLVASRPGCSSLSALPEASQAVWDGQALTLLGERWELDSGRLARMRRCVHEGQLWRFAEQVTFVEARAGESAAGAATVGEAFAADRCPDAPVRARYGYDECPLLSPGTVCAAAEPSACRFEGTLTLTPAPGAAAGTGGGAIAPEATPGELPSSEVILAEAIAAPEREASCRPVGRGSSEPIATGERCFDGECAAGDFCSRELTGEGCAPLGEGLCTPAPLASACDDGSSESNGRSDATGELCLCGEPPMPLARLPLFDPERPGALAPSRCAAHALGLSVVACPSEPGSF